MSLRVGGNYTYAYEILTADETPSGSENTTAQVEETPAQTAAAVAQRK
ncbi:MAG TPA: hypothetical protein VGB00_02345 [Pyrinomonadaceae bacterium]|jgi:hypothetical protein